MKITAKNLILYIGIFITISIIALAIILKITVREQTWQQLAQFNTNYFILLTIAIILRWIFDGLSLLSLTKTNSNENFLVTNHRVEFNYEMRSQKWNRTQK